MNKQLLITLSCLALCLTLFSGGISAGTSKRLSYKKWPVRDYIPFRFKNDNGSGWYDELLNKDYHPELGHATLLSEWTMTTAEAVYKAIITIQSANPSLRFKLYRPYAEKPPVPSSLGYAIPYVDEDIPAEQKYIRFSPRASGCSALSWAEGRRRFDNNISYECVSGRITHEILHNFNWYHMQQSPTRANYVCIYRGVDSGDAGDADPDNIISERKKNFILKSGAASFGKFDFNSTMMYESVDRLIKANSEDPFLTIGEKLVVAEPAYQGEGCLPSEVKSYISQRISLSPIDIWGLREQFSLSRQPQRGPDFNGDGYFDIVIGAYDNTFNDNDESVIIMYGNNWDETNPGLHKKNFSDRDFTRMRQGAKGMDGVREQGDFFGSAIAYGDFNADTYTDLLVGAPGENNNNGLTQVIFGTADKGLQAGSEKLDDRFRKGSQGKKYGYSLAVADFNGDGYSDSASSAIWDGASDTGKVFIHQGSEDNYMAQAANQSFTEDDLTCTNASFPKAEESGDQFGEVMTVGDFNHDGVGDLAIGVPSDNGSRGSVYIVYGIFEGATLLDLDNVDCLRPGEGNISAISSSHWGHSLAAGDFDGDGNDDLAVGAPWGTIGSLESAGTVTVIYGNTDGLDIEDTTVETWTQDDLSGDGAEKTFSAFGYSLKAADLNGDGFTDLSIGAPYQDVSGNAQAGVVHVIYAAYEEIDISAVVLGNPVTFKQAVGTGLSSEGSLIIDGSVSTDCNYVNTCLQAQSYFGQSLSSGDFDNNGFVDLMIGVPGWDEGVVSDAGMVMIQRNTSTVPIYKPLTRIEMLGSGNAKEGDKLGRVLP